MGSTKAFGGQAGVIGAGGIEGMMSEVLAILTARMVCALQIGNWVQRWQSRGPCETRNRDTGAFESEEERDGVSIVDLRGPLDLGHSDGRRAQQAVSQREQIWVKKLDAGSRDATAGACWRGRVQL